MASQTWNDLFKIITSNSTEKYKVKKIQTILKKIKPEDKDNILNKLVEGKTLLGQAFSMYSYELIKLLLENGCNPNGLSSSNQGYSYTAPFNNYLDGVYNTEFIETKKILDLLLLYNFDINTYGLNRETILVKLLKRCIIILLANQNLDTSVIEYFLQKGSNPNLKASLALNNFIYFISDLPGVLSNKNNKKKIFEIIDLLLYYGANPYLVNINGFTIQDRINKINLYQQEFKDKIFLNLDDILKDCENDLIIQKLALAFKIPFTPNDLKNKKKEICDCIQTIKQNFQEIDFDEVVEERKKINNLECVNEYLLSGNDIYEFNKKDLYYLKDNRGETYCFHLNELPNLLTSGKNPYTNADISQETKEDIIKRLKIVPESDNTLEDAISLFNKNAIVDYTLNDLLEIFSHICSPIDPYPDYYNLKDLNKSLIFHLNASIKNINNKLQFFINKDVVINNQNYLNLKIYNLLIDILKIVETVYPEDRLDISTLTHLIRETLSLQACRKDITELFLKEGYDIYSNFNQEIIRKKLLPTLSNYEFKKLDGSKQLLNPSIIQDIIQIILDVGGYKVGAIDKSSAIDVWNNILGYCLNEF